jgi:hypothetical protein
MVRKASPGAWPPQRGSRCPTTRAEMRAQRLILTDVGAGTAVALPVRQNVTMGQMAWR